MPTLRQLEVFAEAAVDLNFRRTAERLGISQPAVSSQIGTLERELNATLFDRRPGQTVVLSDEGRRVLRSAQETLSASRELVTRQDQRRRRITIGLRHYLLEMHVRQHVGDFLEAHPALDLDFTVIDDAAELIRRAQKGEIDFGLFRGDVPTNIGITTERLHTAPCSIYASPGLRDRLNTDAFGLSEAPFVMQPSSLFGTRDAVGDRLREVGITPRSIVARTQFPSILARWCVEGRGLAILFDAHVQQEIAAGLLAPIGPTLRPLDTILIVRRDMRHRPETVIGFLREATAPA